MPDGFAALGELLGGGADTTDEYLGALYTGSRAQKALAEARIKRDEAVQRVRLEEALRSGDDPNMLATIIRAGGGNFQQATAGLGNLQERGFRETAANPEVPFDEANRALMGVASGPVDKFQSIGGSGLFADLFAPDSQPVVSPLGEASIRDRDASAALDAERASTLGPLAEALIGQRNASAALSDERRLHPERFRSPGVSLSFGSGQQPLGDFLADTFPAQSTVPDDLTQTGLEGATGLEGIVRRGANVASDIVGRDELPFPDVDVAQNAMEDLAIRMQTVGQTSIPGRPSNYLMQLLDKRNVNPADILRGDARALNRFQQTRQAVAGDVARLQNMLNTTAGLSKADISDTRVAFDLMRGLLADFDAVLNVLQPTDAEGADGPIDLGGGYSATRVD